MRHRRLGESAGIEHMDQRQGIVSAEPYWRPMSFEIAAEITRIETIVGGGEHPGASPAAQAVW
jgi:hypothetical protein